MVASATRTGTPDSLEVYKGFFVGIAIGAVVGTVAIVLLSWIAWVGGEMREEASRGGGGGYQV